MKKQKPQSPKIKIQDLGHADVPATVGLVKEVRDELRADIRSVDHTVKAFQSDLKGVEHKVDSFKHQLNSFEHQLDSFKHQLNSVEHKLNANIEQVLVAAHRTQVLMEEQRGENRIVLDGIKNLSDRQERLETDLGDLRNTVLIASR